MFIMQKEFNIKPIGTMSHQHFMAGQGREDIPVRNSQKAQLQSWVDEYRGGFRYCSFRHYGN